MKPYSSIDEVIEQVVAPCLGDYIEKFDVAAIARDTFEWTADRNEAGQILLDTAGYVQCVSDEQFAVIVENHAL